MITTNITIHVRVIHENWNVTHVTRDRKLAACCTIARGHFMSSISVLNKQATNKQLEQWNNRRNDHLTSINEKKIAQWNQSGPVNNKWPLWFNARAFNGYQLSNSICTLIERLLLLAFFIYCYICAPEVAPGGSNWWWIAQQQQKSNNNNSDNNDRSGNSCCCFVCCTDEHREISRFDCCSDMMIISSSCQCQYLIPLFCAQIVLAFVYKGTELVPLVTFIISFIIRLSYALRPVASGRLILDKLFAHS